MLPENWRDRQVVTENYILADTETSGKQHQVEKLKRNWWTAGGSRWTSLRFNKSREPNLRRPTTSWVLFPGAQSGSCSKDERTPPSSTSTIREESSHFEICQEHSVLLIKGLPSRQTVFSRAYLTWEKENIQLWPPLAFLPLLRWRWGEGKSEEDTDQGHRHPKRLRPDQRTLGPSLSLSLSLAPLKPHRHINRPL